MRLPRWPQGRAGQALLALGLGALSGSLYWLSIPRIDAYWWAWLCLLPCFLVVRLGSRRQLVVAAATAGLVAAIGRVYWITDTLQLYGGLSFPVSLATNALLVAYLALYPVTFCLGCSGLRFASPLFGWAAASFWVLLEWVQTWMISGFPWELLGYSQYLNRPLVQVASVTGVYGLSFLIVLVNATLSQLLVLRTRWLALAGPPFLLLVVALGFGYHRLGALCYEEGPTLKVGIVQGNFSQDLKWKTDRFRQTTERYVRLTRELAAGARMDLVVFPETALPFFFRAPRFADHYRQVVDLARQIHTPILVGSLDVERSAGQRQVYNRAFLVDADGDIVGTADKVHLVPFGEYLPLPFLFQYLEGLTRESGAFAHGEAHATLSLPAADVDFGVFICFESIFPGITRTLARKGAAFLITTTNDAWFGRSSAPHQHFSMAVLRAVETGRPVLRVANTGISGLISPSGEILARTELFETAVLTVDLHPRAGLTPYARYGNVLLVLSAALLAGVAYRQRRVAPSAA